MEKHQRLECLFVLNLSRPNPVSRSEDSVPLGSFQELKEKIESMCEDCNFLFQDIQSQSDVIK